MSSFTTYYGIDISKDTLDIVELNASQELSKSILKQIKNTKLLIKKWIKQLNKTTSFCVLEATGTYSSKLVYWLT